MASLSDSGGQQADWRRPRWGRSSEPDVVLLQPFTAISLCPCLIKPAGVLDVITPNFYRSRNPFSCFPRADHSAPVSAGRTTRCRGSLSVLKVPPSTELALPQFCCLHCVCLHEMDHEHRLAPLSGSEGSARVGWGLGDNGTWWSRVGGIYKLTYPQRPKTDF